MEIAGLYRSPGLKQRLEARLIQAPGIRSVSASTLTGRILIRYDAGTRLENIVTLVESCLKNSRQKVKPRARRSASLGAEIKKALHGLGGLLSPGAAGTDTAAKWPWGLEAKRATSDGGQADRRGGRSDPMRSDHRGGLP